jgi:hypothetical protein
MNRSTVRNIAQLIAGVLIFIAGFRDNQYRFIPPIMYLIFGAVLVIYSLWRLVASSTEDDK